MPFLVFLLMTSLSAPTVVAQTGAPNGEWPSYGGDDGSTKYAPLDQIDADNVDRLEVAWRWESSDTAVINENRELGPAGFKATPLMVDGVLYIRTSLSIVAAIDAETGEERWVRDVGSYESGRPTNLGFNSRGVAHWSDGDDARIFLATGDAHLWSFDTATGRPIGRFGADGKIDLTLGLRRPVDRRVYQVISPPLVVGDVVIVDSSISDGPRYMTAPPGDIRGFDVRTGELRWTFHTVPQAGEAGNDAWENDSWTYTGNTNAWSIMSADQELGYLYVPSRTNPISVRLDKADPERSDFNYMRGRTSLRGPQDLPLVKPPYVRLTAIDLSTGEHAWQVTLGDGPRQRLIEMGVSDPGPLGGGAYTGPLVTKTLLFLGLGGGRQSAQDPVLNAFDKATGEIVHAVNLPATLTGTPMTYMAGGKQYIVAAYGRGAESGLIALKLP